MRTLDNRNLVWQEEKSFKKQKYYFLQKTFYIFKNQWLMVVVLELNSKLHHKSKKGSIHDHLNICLQYI
jgi:hypothetical protein